MNIGDCQNFSEILRCQSRLKPERIFLHDLRSDRTYTFRQFDEIVDRSVQFLKTQNVRKGDILTAVLSNSPEYAFLYFASLRIGAIFNPMPFSSHRQEILKNIKMVEPSLVLVDLKRKAEFEKKEKTFAFIPVGQERLFEKSLHESINGVPKDIPIDEKTPACLYYSSGTTGDPKGVLFTHRNMIKNISSICRGFNFKSKGETHLVFLPLGHTASINYSFLPCAYIGGKIVLCEDFWSIRNQIWDLVQKFDVTYMETVPTVLYSLLNIYKTRPLADTSSLRFVGCGSAPLQKGIQAEFKVRFGLNVANLYGLSETGPTHVDYPLESGWEPGSIGIPLDVNEVKIFREDEQECTIGIVGELAIKGDNVFPGYFKNKSLYNQVVRNGYFFTGDLGYRDINGKYYFVDRKKDLIIKGGINIVPGEIDEVLLLHPAVKEGITVGIPNELFGEDIHSFVVLKEAAQATEIDILEHCRNHLSSIKVPQKVSIVADIPKTHSGKLLRKQIREFAEKHTDDQEFK